MHCRLRCIQDLTQADVSAALSKLRGVSAECISLLGRVLQVDPLQRLTLLQIMEVREGAERQGRRESGSKTWSHGRKGMRSREQGGSL